MAPPPRTAAGFALLETLAALLVVSFGLLVLGRSQMRLWQAVDLARDQSTALALAQTDLEHRREEAGGSTAAHDAMASTDERDLPLGPTVYRTSGSVAHDADWPLAALDSRVRWQDREGRWHRASLHTLLARHDRRTSGWLALAPDGLDNAAPIGSAPTVPPQARQLADGRIALKPRADQPDTWLFDANTGRISATCTAPVGLRNDRLQPSDLSACHALDGRLLSGWVGFTAAGVAPTVQDAERPPGPVLETALQLTLTGPGAPSARCLAGAGDEPHPDGALPYWCLVQPGGAAWSGRLDLVPVGWSVAAAADDSSPAPLRRVCRYSADHDHNGRIDNLEHPASYTGVQEALQQQNFLVIPAGATCPVDAAAQLDPGVAFNAVDDTTVPHQP